jgi:hypothetical protein
MSPNFGKASLGKTDYDFETIEETLHATPYIPLLISVPSAPLR